MNERDTTKATAWAGGRRLLLLVGLLLIPSAVHAYLGTFSRYVADDYCTAATTRELGFWGSQAHWYANWTGRYAYNGTLALLELSGPEVVPALPVSVILAWTVSLGWTLQALLPAGLLAAFPRRWFLPAVLASLVVGLTLMATPDVYQSAYWQTGLVNYVVPLILLTLQAGILARIAATSVGVSVTSRLWPSLALGVLAWTSAAYSETYLIFQVLLYLAAVVWFSLGRRSGRSVNGLVGGLVGLFGTAIGAALVVLAPGNAVRMALMPEHPTITGVLLESIRYAASFSAKSLLWTPVGYLSGGLLAAGLGGIVGARVGLVVHVRDRRTVSIVVVTGLAVALLMVSLMIPSAYATAAYPVDRALIAPTYLLILGATGAGFGAGILLQSKVGGSAADLLGRSIVPLVLALGLVFSMTGATDALAQATDIRNYASQWDRRQLAVGSAQRAGLRDLEVNPLPHIAYLPELEEDPQNWVNRCFAQYHDVDSVVAR